MKVRVGLTTVLIFVNKFVEAVHILALVSKYLVNNEGMLKFTLVLFMILLHQAMAMPV
jgi:hypothetical protein